MVEITMAFPQSQLVQHYYTRETSTPVPHCLLTKSYTHCTNRFLHFWTLIHSSAGPSVPWRIQKKCSPTKSVTSFCRSKSRIWLPDLLLQEEVRPHEVWLMWAMRIVRPQKVSWTTHWCHRPAVTARRSKFVPTHLATTSTSATRL